MPRLEDITPNRALTGQPVDVVITGSGFGNNPTVQAGSGISVVINSSTSTTIHARFNMAGNVAPGNHAVFVTASTGFTSNGGNFFVQVPSEFIALMLSNADLMCSTGTVGYGAQVRYQVADQMRQPIQFAGMLPQENFTVTDASGTHEAFPGFLPFATPPSTDSNGRFLDIPVGTCFLPPSPPTQNGCIVRRQTFNLRVAGVTHNIPTVTSSCDCVLGLGIRVINGINVASATLGMTACSN